MGKKVQVLTLDEKNQMIARTYQFFHDSLNDTRLLADDVIAHLDLASSKRKVWPETAAIQGSEGLEFINLSHRKPGSMCPLYI